MYFVPIPLVVVLKFSVVYRVKSATKQSPISKALPAATEAEQGLMRC